MFSMLGLLARLPAYWLSRRWGRPRPLPMSYTFSLTFRCNSRCATCNVWRKEADELSVEEWGRVFDSLGRAPYWVTISGGEPLLREDAVEIVDRLCRRCRPAVLNIPTNGLLPERIERSVAAIARSCPSTQVVVNLSLDGWGEEHDRIRGVPGNFERAMETYRRLRALDVPNLTLGVHTVISRLNAARVPDLYVRVRRELAPDSYITEIAEERNELGTVGAPITPTAEAYTEAVERLIALQATDHFAGLGRITRALRRRYYRLVERWLREQRQVIPCYAGWASAQIAPDGEVWFCCVEAVSVGNLREVDYDFRRIWWGERAQVLRQRVRSGGCHCPLANAAMTNMLFHPPSLLGVAADVLRGDGR